MSDLLTQRGLNSDGFSADDVAARSEAQRGRPHPDDSVIMSVREAYRAGRPEYRVCLGTQAYNRTAEAERLMTALGHCFPTSRIVCYPDPEYQLGVKLSVTFPEG